MATVEQQKAKERVAVLHVQDSSADFREAAYRTPQLKLDEAVNLTLALDVDVVASDLVNIKKSHPHAYLGKGKVDELTEYYESIEVDLVVVNTRLTPTQQRNLEVAWQRKVVDRTGLILEIFADRARTHAGRLQVQLARLNYEQSRLVRTWTHLERQRGGLGKTGGPGERQIELDRRIIRDRITQIRKELKDVEKTRHLHRKARTKAGLPVVALVGYTNAGKSTLFNALCGDEETLSKDMLFATLDPLMRKIKLESGREIILSDTVGFVSDLPHELVEAFHATLEEVAAADVLLHVHDASSEDAVMQNNDVAEVLEMLEAHKLPRIDVLNKMDLVEGELNIELEGVQTSAVTNEGLSTLKATIEKALSKNEVLVTYKIPVAHGKAIAWLHAQGQVLSSDFEEAVNVIQVKLSQEDKNIFEAVIFNPEVEGIG